MKILTNALLKLVEIASVLGLDENSLRNSKDFLAHNEFGLCFDSIITQMYECDIEIDNDSYKTTTPASVFTLPRKKICFLTQNLYICKNTSASNER